MSTNQYQNYIIFYICALSGIISMLYIGLIINKDRILELFGKFSLYMFCTQRIFFKIFPILIDRFNVTILNRGIGKIYITIAVYFFIFALINYIKRKCKRIS